MAPEMTQRRGDPVATGNVYANSHGAPHYKIVLAIMARDGERTWSNCVCLHVNAAAKIVGCSRVPEAYLSHHNDLVGRVKSMPEMDVEWIRTHPQAGKLKVEK
jgi:hypothetical protein